MPSRFLPDTTLGQILAILLGGLLLTLAVIVCLLILLHPTETALLRGPRSTALQIATVVDTLDALPPSDRPAVAAAMHSLAAPNPACLPDHLDFGAQELARTLDHLLPTTPFSVRRCPAAGQLQIAVPSLPAVFDVTIASRSSLALLLHIWMPLIGALVFLFILVAILSAWAIARVIFPLRRLSQAVDTFGREVAVAPLAEEGPREIRRAARAINQMQQRIAASLADRTRMLAAISHDLRTPITRLRLRTELEATGDARSKTLRDIDLMRRMVDSALDYLRGTPGEAADEPAERIDLAALLQTICDEAIETGADVAFQPTHPLLCECRPNALARAITNLVENACRYGTTARLSASRTPTAIRIEVADAGPGIPENLREEALRPFARLSTARKPGDGVGLGLAIVADIVRQHAGLLHLRNAPDGGLIATIELPQPRINA